MSGISKINNINFGATIKTDNLSPDYKEKIANVVNVFEKATAKTYPYDTFELYSDEKGSLLFAAECRDESGNRNHNRGKMSANAAKKFFAQSEETIFGKLYQMLETFHRKDKIYKKGASLLDGIEELVRTEDNEINQGLEAAYVEMWDAFRQKGISVIKDDFKQDSILKDIKIDQ